jgi:membrane protein DedA with SNARE-associated domain
VAAIVVGSLAGESVGFAIGHRFGPALRSSRLGRRIGERNWERAETYLARRGGVAVLLSRFLPVFHSLVPVTVGTSPMRYRTFLAWSAPACVVWALAYVSVGAAAAGGYRELSESLHLAGWIFLAVVVVFVIAAFLIRRALHRREERHMDAASE